MIILITLVISFLGIIGGKFLFKQWINHLTLYCTIWGVMIILYEMMLLPYSEIIPLAWFLILTTFLSFLFGILTFTSGLNLYSNNQFITTKMPLDIKIFADGGKTVKYTLLFCSGIALFAAVQHWMVLINKFGSIPVALFNANLVRKLNISGEVKGVIPYISNFGIVAVFFAGIYTAYKGKFSLYAILPFLAVILESLAIAGRVNILFAFMEFSFTFFLFRQLLKHDSLKRYKFSRKNVIIAFTTMIIILVTIMSFVRISRVTQENYEGASKELRQLQGNLFITPSIYLYLSSCVGVLNAYLKSDGEKTKFGENTFILFHYILSDLDLRERPPDLQKGYQIPIWTNTGTYIRELDADFGITGVFLVPYLLGLLSTLFWFKFFKHHQMISLALLVFIYLIIGFSFLMMITRLGMWSFSIVILLFMIPIVEKIAMHFSNELIVN